MIDHMPGTPDGMARAPDGNFWFPLLAKIPPTTKVSRWTAAVHGQKQPVAANNNRGALCTS